MVQELDGGERLALLEVRLRLRARVRVRARARARARLRATVNVRLRVSRASVRARVKVSGERLTQVAARGGVCAEHLGVRGEAEDGLG